MASSACAAAFNLPTLPANPCDIPPHIKPGIDVCGNRTLSINDLKEVSARGKGSRRGLPPKDDPGRVPRITPVMSNVANVSAATVHP
jgi:hypothetical protein